ncbi:hypothetical protein M408DRAFT_24082 [Serendipita vermifera MAFF 305830]|uniref:F-box domain-containing protein n=1 Tax=Serendipita vermifera MAFF 305830 TaxID=933852 RepID=A0A0C3B7F0_SERVB|nr:hypothetical protein M408DRAFT_24082 [Serendipita vermifera MAFF 305830]
MKYQEKRKERKRQDYRNKRRMLRKTISRLDVDVMIEIFRHFVANEADGVFILTLVSRAWRDLVVGLPVLWQWITIDQSMHNWREKMDICVALSKQLPLQIVFRLPIRQWGPILPILTRCQNIFMEIPSYMNGRDVTENTTGLTHAVELPASSKIHWVRAGQKVAQESREASLTPMPEVSTLELTADGSEHPNYHSYARTREPRYLEEGDSFHPLILLTHYKVLEILQNATNLRSLTISHHATDPLSSDIDLPLVTLDQLEDLSVRDIDYDRNGCVVSLLEYLRCPNLSKLLLAGKCTDVVESMVALRLLGRPINLILDIQYKAPKQNSTNEELFEPDPPYEFPFIKSLGLIIAGPKTNDGWNGRNPPKEIIYVLEHLRHLTSLRITVVESAWYFPDEDKIPCVHHLRYEPCHVQAARAYPEIQLPFGNQIVELDIKLPFHRPCVLT